MERATEIKRNKEVPREERYEVNTILKHHYHNGEAQQRVYELW